MPFCPECRSEYLPGIARCAPCNVELVQSSPESDDSRSDNLRAALVDWKPSETSAAIPIMRATYSEACQVVDQLHAGGVDAAVTGDPKSCQPGGQCAHFFVAILRDDLEAAHQLLKSDWKRLLEGDTELANVDPDAAVDFDAEGPRTCPACSASFEGSPKECPDCGLFLGEA